jgi:hypothetical protein
MRGFRFFDGGDEFAMRSRQLPHWAQAGTLVFITWRTADSLPRELQERLMRERGAVLGRMGLDPSGDWRGELAKLLPADRGRVKWALFQQWDDLLDSGAGACELGRPELAGLVKESLLHFDGERYVLTDCVVMPNHVHLLAAFPDERGMLAQCESWKRFTARAINQRLGREGAFWQVESFDHLVRSEEQFWHYRRYVAENGRKAGLKGGEYRWYSKDVSGLIIDGG